MDSKEFLQRLKREVIGHPALTHPFLRRFGEGDLDAEGTRLRRIGDAVAVTWRRGGHTCVMKASPGVTIDTVAELAAWKAKGAIRF